MIGEGPVDPDLARGIAHAPAADASTLIRLARACTRNARVQTEILRASACDDFVRGALGTVSEDPGIRQLAWSTMRDPNGLGLADLSDRPSLIGVCANPRMTEAVAGEIVRARPPPRGLRTMSRCLRNSGVVWWPRPAGTHDAGCDA